MANVLTDNFRVEIFQENLSRKITLHAMHTFIIKVTFIWNLQRIHLFVCNHKYQFVNPYLKMREFSVCIFLLKKTKHDAWI